MAGFAVLGALLGLRAGGGQAALAAAGGALLLGEAGAWSLRRVLRLSGTAVDAATAARAVADGYLMVLPFAVLALLAQLVWNWDAGLVFLGAAIATANTTTVSALPVPAAGGWRSGIGAVLATLLMVTLAGALATGVTS